jgi:hypothetical protein
MDGAPGKDYSPDGPVEEVAGVAVGAAGGTLAPVHREARQALAASEKVHRP